MEYLKIIHRLHLFECFYEYFAYDSEKMTLFKLSKEVFRRLQMLQKTECPLSKGDMEEKLKSPFPELLLQDDHCPNFAGLKDYLTVCLFLTHDCNMNCSYCFDCTNRETKSRSELNFVDAVRIIERALKHSDQLVVWFFGGEPLLKIELLKQIVEYCTEIIAHSPHKHFYYSITTNGLLLDQQTVDFFEDHKFSVMMSLDGTEDEKYAGVNQKKNLAGLELALQRQSGFHLVTRTTVSRENTGIISDLYWDLRKKGVRSIYLCPSFGGELNDVFSKEDALKWTAQFRKLIWQIVSQGTMEDMNAFVQMNENFFYLENRVYKNHYCPAGSYMAAMDVDGKLYPCQRFTSKGLGQIDSFNKKRYKQGFKCTACWAFSLCGGGICSFFEQKGGCNKATSESVCRFKQSMIELTCWAYSHMKSKSTILATKAESHPL